MLNLAFIMLGSIGVNQWIGLSVDGIIFNTMAVAISFMLGTLKE